MAQKTIVVIEDDPRILRFIQSGIKLSGYKVETASSGEEGLDLVHVHEPDLIILDIGLPGIDGWEVLKQLRLFSTVPVIILSARGEDIDKVRGLKLGADDYLSKPFNPDELTARIEAVMRRTQKAVIPAQDIKTYGEVTIDLGKHQITANGKAKKLTRQDSLLLGYLINNSGKVLTYEDILNKVWGSEYINDVQLLRTAVNRLRDKLCETPGQEMFIKNIARVGYLFDPNIPGT
jgi:DNA-binding response OmpR family regulator